MSSRSQSPPKTVAIPEKSYDILAQRLPDILVHQNNRTESDALHGIRFKGELGHWQSFQQEVEQFLKTCKFPGQILSYRPEPFSNIHLVNEQVRCGDELSVSGRFTQNALHPVAAISSLMALNIVFGDFKICSEAHRAQNKTGAFKNPEEPSSDPSKKKNAKIPDYVAVHKADSRLRFLGEAKTPWKHDLEDYIANYKNGRSVKSLEKAFGK